ncbi:UDP-3-O-acyl-N-acetylglucosamine deacetylase [Neobacillus cucumis]|uniref:UDP-3-O-acyl-N-acetylglucosamine deacetylase n=1 Tax=Neobacillus cucumis TaxID=1740721 RepID=UPI0019622F30|nr:UDP-3-O-acyl-N-acetylglucosamine deacetylase [Neobacillus cucumis]MBM7651250.1 UDP-3-O-acyl-N-acetylglucosamine deacetylase [Neobacillus cucumis]
MQKSIKNSVQCSGTSITGEIQSTVTFYPSPPDSGVVFVRDDLQGKTEIECVAQYAQTDSRWTSLVKNNNRIEHTEHILAAITGLGIDNIKVHLNSPHIPVVSQFSCKDFVDALLRAEIITQPKPKRFITLTKPQWVFDSFYYNGQRYDSMLIALPAAEPTYTYLLDYPSKKLPTQLAHYKLTTALDFVTELSSARSYIMDEEFDLVKNLIGNAMDQCLVISEGTGHQLRWENEPARHKLVDLIGDITTLGHPVKGHFIGIRSGHKTNIKMSKKIMMDMESDLP